MSGPGPPPQGQLSLVDCLGGLGLVLGALAGAVWGGWKYGVWGAVVGLPLGAVAGVVGVIALVVVCIATVIPIVILWTEGPRGLWRLVRGRWEPPAPPTDTNSSVG